MTQFEERMLRILSGVLGETPAATVMPLIEQSPKFPAVYLTPDAADLLQQALARGVTRFLAHGSWRRERFLDRGQPTEGRLWERHKPESLGLMFSGRTVKLLVELAQRTGERSWPRLGSKAPTSGDVALHFLVVRFLVHSGENTKLLSSVHHSRNPLVALCFPDLVGEHPVQFEPLLHPGWSWMVESLQGELAIQWRRIEHEKRRISSLNQIIHVGRRQERVLAAFLEACQQAQRPDLVRFLFLATRAVLDDFPQPDAWTKRLSTIGVRLSARERAYRATLILLHYFLQLRKWHQRFLSVGYFDEEYQLAQLWKSDWEAFKGDELCQLAGNMIGQVDPLGTGPEPQPAPGNSVPE